MAQATLSIKCHSKWASFKGQTIPSPQYISSTLIQKENSSLWNNQDYPPLFPVDISPPLCLRFSDPVEVSTSWLFLPLGSPPKPSLRSPKLAYSCLFTALLRLQLRAHHMYFYHSRKFCESRDLACFVPVVFLAPEQHPQGVGALWTAPGCGSEWVHVPASCRTLLLGAEDPLPRLSPSPSGHSGWKPRGSWLLLLPGGHTCETSGEPGRPRGSCHRPWWLTRRFSRRGCSQKPVSYPVPSGADWQWLLHSPVRWLAALAMWPKCPIVALTFTSLTLTMFGGKHPVPEHIWNGLHFYCWVLTDALADGIP